MVNSITVLVSSHSVNASLKAGKVVLADTLTIDDNPKEVTFRICAYHIKGSKFGRSLAYGKSLATGKWHLVYNVRNE